ncbi:Crp/Fnr family transcriptional regulator [Rhizobium gallicum]|uniref:Crp/Fnr family transcriptional regulator n=1 Tax=Rhizobium gallicum TaxID=56730 RepID=UPI000AA3ACCA|nr:cyclic nucleotide-binding domain-containing protein [Rhizobium gallicum]
MSEPFIDQFLRLATGEATFAAGQHIFNQGDAITWLYLMQAGTIHLVRHQADGNVAVLQRASPGMVLAEASVFSSHYHCDAVAVTNSEALVIPVNSVRWLLRNEPVFAEYMGFLSIASAATGTKTCRDRDPQNCGGSSKRMACLEWWLDAIKR